MAAFPAVTRRNTEEPYLHPTDQFRYLPHPISCGQQVGFIANRAPTQGLKGTQLKGKGKLPGTQRSKLDASLLTCTVQHPGRDKSEKIQIHTGEKRSYGSREDPEGRVCCECSRKIQGFQVATKGSWSKAES
jgi:hypothetical protein